VAPDVHRARRERGAAPDVHGDRARANAAHAVAPDARAWGTTDTGDGWYRTADTAGGIVTVAGCAYPNAWDATGVPVPTALCTGTAHAGARREVPAPVVTGVV
jgi:hypothetical protein